MNANTKKILTFGLLGAAGCLAGWVLGEVLLFATTSKAAGRDAAPSLAAAPPPPAPELAERLAREKAQTGEVQFSLLWYNLNDLDLHCIDPLGNWINFQDRHASSGGYLDVDMNALLGRSSDRPVENIFFREAPLGRYQVFIHHFAKRGGTDPSKYKLDVVVRDQRRTFEGEISNTRSPFATDLRKKELVKIHEFELRPLGEAVALASRTAWSWRSVLVIGLWTALLAIGLSLALVMGQNYYLASPLLSGAQASILLPGAVAAGLAAGGVGQMLLMGLTWAHLPAKLGFLVGWLLLGALLGRGLGFFIANLDAWRAAGAGAAGGLLGALVFLVVSAAGDVAGRLLGSAILGAAIGSMVALVEVAFRKAWLEIVYGPKEVGTVNLGDAPVSVGSDRKRCTVWARDAAPVAAVYRFQNGRVVCEDPASGKVTPLPTDHRQKIGTVEVVVRGQVDATIPEALAAPVPATPVQAAVPREAPTAPPRPPSPDRPYPQPHATPTGPARPAAEAARPIPAPPAPAAASPPAANICEKCNGRAGPAPHGKRYCIRCDRYF